MRRLWALTKVIVTSGFDDLYSLSNLRKKKESKSRRIMQTVLLLFLFVYVAVIIFVPVSFLTKEFVKLGQEGLIMTLLFTFGPVVSLFFAILSVPGVFYFAKDTEDLIVLPIKPWEIIVARFVSAYVQTLIGSALIYLPVIISYFVFANPGILFIFTSLIAFLLVPIIPLIIAFLVTIIIMTFIPIVKNKDVYMYLSFALAFIPIFIISFGASGMSIDDSMMQAIQQSLIAGDNQAFQFISLFFPTSKYLVGWILNFNILDLLIVVVVSFALCFGIIFITQNFYFKGLVGVKESSSKKRKLRKNEEDSYIKVNSIQKAFITSDIKRIMRTPTFAINYFSPIIILPIAFTIPMFLEAGSSIKYVLSQTEEIAFMFHELFNELTLLQQLAYPIGLGFALGLFMGNMDGSSNTAISREGHTMKLYLTMPIKFSDMVHAKARFSLIFSSVMPILITIIAVIFLRPNVVSVLLFVIGTALGILMITYIAILVDVLYPSLNWVSEQQAVKGNFKQVLVMIPFMFIPMIIGFFTIFAPPLFSLITILIVMPIVVYLLIKAVSKFADTRLVEKVQNL